MRNRIRQRNRSLGKAYLGVLLAVMSLLLDFASAESTVDQASAQTSGLAFIYIDLDNKRIVNLLQIYNLSEKGSRWRSLALQEVYRDVFMGWVAHERGYTAHAGKRGVRMPFQWVTRELLERARVSLTETDGGLRDPLGIGDWRSKVVDVVPKSEKESDKQWHSSELEAKALLELFGSGQHYRKLAIRFASMVKNGEIGSD